MVPVSSMINFIRIDGPTGVIQTGSNFSRGYNGVGGVTAEGSIRNWEVFRDAKRFSHRVRFSILSNIGHYDVSMVVSSDNRASATVSGMWRGRLTWDGHWKRLVIQGFSRGRIESEEFQVPNSRLCRPCQPKPRRRLVRLKSSLKHGYLVFGNR